MYVGGLEAAAGATATLVDDVSTDGASTSRGVPYQQHEFGSRAASGAVRELHHGPTGAEDGVPWHASRRRRSVLIGQLAVIDALAAVAAVATAYLARFEIAGGNERWVNQWAAFAVPALWLAVTALNGGYDLRFVGFGSTEFGRLARAFAHLTLATVFVSYAARLDLARGFLVLALPLTLLLSWVGRCLARARLRRMRRSGRAMSRVLAVGGAESVRALALSMRADPAAGLHVVGACLPPHQVDDLIERRRLAELGVPVFGGTSSVSAAVERSGARSVAVIAGDVGTAALRSISWELEGTGADLIVSSGLSEVVGQRVHVQPVAGLPLLRVDPPHFRGLRPALKGVFDRLVAVTALILLAPLLLLLAVLVRCTSRGPAFYLQQRVGRGGRPFRMVKFRSMHVGADTRLPDLEHSNVAEGPLFKLRDDPRVTPIGRWLRRFSLDELPQLLNIATGSMSLVGPRPPLPSEVAQYEGDVRRRLLVKPGLTGLWQVSGRSDLSWEDAVRLDLHYVENWSFTLDLLVLFRTARVVLRATGAY
jgi:exopolysaccharide biosynthesis polyprenyl glycosylphosphotransferase